MNLIQAIKALAADELVEVQREGWFAIDGLEGEGTFEVQRDICEQRVACLDRNMDILTFGAWFAPDLPIILEHSHAFWGHVDLEPRNDASFEQVGWVFRGSLRWGLSVQEEGWNGPEPVGSRRSQGKRKRRGHAQEGTLRKGAEASSGR